MRYIKACAVALLITFAAELRADLQHRVFELPLPVDVPTARNQTVKPEAEALLIAARRKAASKDLNGALRDLNAALHIQPKFGAALLTRGCVRYDLNDFPRALEDTTKAVELLPTDVRAIWLRGVLYNQGRKSAGKAYADFERCIDLDPRFAPAYYSRGRCRDLTNSVAARADFDKAIELDPGLLEAYLYRANGLIAQRHYEDAVKDLDRAVELEEPLFRALAYWSRGRAKMGLDELKEALADFNAAIAIEPHHASFYVGRGGCFWGQRRFDKAIADFNRAIALRPQSGMYVMRAKAYESQRDYEKAIADCKIALKLDPKNVDAYVARGSILSAESRFKEAVAACDHALALRPNLVQPLIIRSRANLALHNFFGASADYKRALAIEPNSMEVKYLGGEIEATGQVVREPSIHLRTVAAPNKYLHGIEPSYQPGHYSTNQPIFDPNRSFGLQVKKPELPH